MFERSSQNKVFHITLNIAFNSIFRPTAQEYNRKYMVYYIKVRIFGQKWLLWPGR